MHELTQHLDEQQLGCEIIILPDGFGRPNSGQSSHEHLGYPYLLPAPATPKLYVSSFLGQSQALGTPSWTSRLFRIEGISLMWLNI